MTSKRNSDASGLKYQWGRKSPFTFATRSELWGVDYERGKYPVKIYTIDGVLIYQDEKGYSNKAKQPVGGIIVSSTLATSMMEAIRNPITFYQSAIITQVGHTRDLWDYYWTSYSRGTDGRYGYKDKNWHNNYLDRYVTQRQKSIYDPCPYGFKIQSNGTYNDFNQNTGWVGYSYVGGISWTVNETKNWWPALSRRQENTGCYAYTGIYGLYFSANPANSIQLHSFLFHSSQEIQLNRTEFTRSFAPSVRCIEEMTIVNIQKFAQSKFLVID